MALETLALADWVVALMAVGISLVVYFRLIDKPLDRLLDKAFPPREEDVE